MSDELLDLQAALKTYLAAKEYFSDSLNGEAAVPIPIVTEDAADLESEIEKSINQAGGICVLIRTPGGDLPHGDSGAPIYEPCILHIRVYENPTVNRYAGGTLQPGCKVANAIIKYLWTFNVAVPGYNAIVPAGKGFGQEKDGTPYHDIVLKTVVAMSDAEPTRN